VEPEEATVWDGETGRFLLEFLVDRAFFVISGMVATTENTSDIIRAFCSVTVLCGVITCAFDASWFEMAVFFCVSVSLAVCALSNIPFVLGRFKFDFALLEVFDKEYIPSSSLSQGSLLTLYPPTGQSVSCPIYPNSLKSCSSNGSFHSLSTTN
jgi:hypothetical protein